MFRSYLGVFSLVVIFVFFFNKKKCKQVRIKKHINTSLKNEKLNQILKMKIYSIFACYLMAMLLIISKVTIEAAFIATSTLPNR